MNSIVIVLVVAAVAAVGVAVYKHITLAQVKADIGLAITKSKATVATIKADLQKWL